MEVSEKYILDIIKQVLKENKTFLKLGNQGGGNAMPPMNNPMPPMDMGADPMAGGDPNMGGTPADMGTDPMAGGDPNAADDTNQFDSNFDAGVEADEDADPKKYIQQLTGKLSQKLNSFASDNGSDSAETAKYVGQMIIKAVSKMLDDDAKKDLIKTINTTDNDTDDSMDSEGSDGVNNGGEEAPADDMGGQDMGTDPNMQQGQPMMEMKFSKRDIKLIMEQFNDVPMDIQGQEENRPKETKNKLETGPFAAKRFIKR